MSFMALDGVMLFIRLKDVIITCKRMRCSLIIGGSSSVPWRKFKEADDFKCVFVVNCV